MDSISPAFPGRIIMKSGFTCKTIKKTAVIIAVTILILEAAMIGGISTSNSPSEKSLILASSSNREFHWQNVKTFGAMGDGRTDDTKTIQAAINAGIHIYFPPGTYVVDQLFISNINDVVLCGYDATLIKKAGSVTWTRILDIKAVDNLMIFGLTLDGNKQNVAGSPQEGCGSINANGLTDFLLTDLTICNSYFGSVNLSNCHNGTIKNAVFDDIDVGIIGMGVANSDISIDHCVFSNGTSEGISFGIYTKITAEDFARFGYHHNIKITNCSFINKNANCIQLHNVKNVLISNNSFERTDLNKNTAGIMINPDAIAGLSVVPDNIEISSNQFQGMRFEGVAVTGGTRVTIRDNYFKSIYSYNIVAKCSCLIENNTFSNIHSGLHAIVYAQAHNIQILNNYFEVDASIISCIIWISSQASGITVIKNIWRKEIATPFIAIDFESKSSTDHTISENTTLEHCRFSF